MDNFEHTTWRLIKTPPATGAWNMAVDEAMLDRAKSGDYSPTLRLFSWNPACLSLGFGQRYREVDVERLKAHGWDVVRRATGGRAILHTDELTYSVVGTETHPRLEGGIMPSYQRISTAILKAIELLHVDAIAHEHSEDLRAGHEKPVCFEVPARYEITVNDKKLVGSAQARRKGGVLQHGTLPLHGDLTRITEALVYPNEAERKIAGEQLLEKATTVEYALGRAVSWEETAAAFIQGFEETLNLTLDESELTTEELVRADELVAEKYGNPNWNERR